MKRKEILERKQQRYEKKRAELIKRSNESQNVDEVRDINEKLQEIAEELQDIKDELLAMKEDEEEEDGNGEEENRSGEPKLQGGEMRGNQILGAFRQNTASAEKSDDPTETQEYRKAFMEFVCRGVPIPNELRANLPQLRAEGTTTTTDASAVIPTTMLNEIIQKMETYGNVWARVRKLNIQGGVEIPILTLKPEANWINESEKNKDQKLSSDDKISFSYFGVECKIAQTLLANVVTLDMFQKMFVPLAAEAIVKAIEKAIFVGTGKGQPTGILKDTRVPKDNIIIMSPEEMTWNGWHKKVKAKMKKAYRNGQFYMTQSTLDGEINGMEDKNGQPIARLNYGLDGKEINRFLGKEVETVEEDVLVDYQSAKKGDVFAVFINMNDYGVNSNLQMQTVKWTDHDTNEVKNKCIMICDGKLIDANGVLIIKKGDSKTSTGTDSKTDEGTENE